MSTDGLPAQKVQPTPPVKETEQIVKPTPSCSPVPTPFPEGLIDPRVGEDSDCDGINDISDNCLLVYNPNQKDKNGDGKGDACDPKLVDKSFVDLRCDMDGDGIPDDKDNCPWVCNSDQKFVDVNKNGVNDLCDNAFPNAILGQKFCAKRINVKAPKPTKSKNSGSY